jgi:RNA polymerase-binding protein DksA
VSKAKKSAKAVLVTARTLPLPVEIEPRPLDTPLLRALKKERARLLNELKHQEVVEQDHPTTGNHMADDATEVSEQAKTLALRRHLEGMLKEVERAIARAEKGTYGICERCRNPISEERLKVMPSATLCIDCAKLQIRSLKVAA